MLGWNNIGHFGELSNHKEFLNHVGKVNSPQPHVVHKHPIEWPARTMILPHMLALKLKYLNSHTTMIDSHIPPLQNN